MNKTKLNKAVALFCLTGFLGGGILPFQKVFAEDSTNGASSENGTETQNNNEQETGNKNNYSYSYQQPPSNSGENSGGGVGKTLLPYAIDGVNKLGASAAAKAATKGVADAATNAATDAATDVAKNTTKNIGKMAEGVVKDIAKSALTSAIIGMLPGIPIPSSTSSYKFSNMGLDGYPVCNVSNKDPEVTENQKATCIVYVPGGWAVPPIISKTSGTYNYGGKETLELGAPTFKWHGGRHPWMEVGYVSVTVGSEVYQGTNGLAGGGIWGSSDWMKDGNAFGWGKSETLSSGRRAYSNAIFGNGKNDSYDFSNSESMINDRTGALDIAGGKGLLPWGNSSSNNNGGYANGKGYLNNNGGFFSNNGGSISNGGGSVSNGGGSVSNSGGFISNIGGFFSKIGGFASNNGGSISNSGGSVSNNGSGSFSDSSFNGGSGGGAFGDIINDALNDRGGSFNFNGKKGNYKPNNASVEDWSSSSGGKISGSKNLDNYFNSGGYRGGVDSLTNMPNGLTNDLFGFDTTPTSPPSWFDSKSFLDENGNIKSDIANAMSSRDFWLNGKEPGTINGQQMWDFYENAAGMGELSGGGGGLYDQNGNPIDGFYDADGNPISAFFDSNGNFVDANGNSIKVYDRYGNEITGVFDRNGKKIDKSLFYDANGDGVVDIRDLIQQLSEKDSLLAKLSGKDGLQSVLDSIFGDDNSLNKSVQGTLSIQDMYAIAKQVLLNAGFDVDDIMNGRNYSEGSAYTDPDDSWDFNRITTLMKARKITPVTPDEIRQHQEERRKALAKKGIGGFGMPLSEEPIALQNSNVQ